MMPLFAVLSKGASGAGAKMMRNVACEPVARLGVEPLVRPPTIVTDRFFERRLDVDEGEVIEHVPNQHSAKLPHRDAPREKLVFGPQRGAVHVEQRAVEIEKGGGLGTGVLRHRWRRKL